jgi:hypothetical protein
MKWSRDKMTAAIIPVVFLIVIVLFGAILEHFFGG